MPVATTPDGKQGKPADNGTGGQEAAIDVNRPVAACYNQLLRVEEFPRFLGGVARVDRIGNHRATWFLNNEDAPLQSTVEFHGLVDDQRFAWRRVDGPAHEGSIQLEALAPDQTRVRLVRAHQPGPVREATGLGSSMGPGGVQQDLLRFKRLVESRRAPAADGPRRVDLPCALVGLTPPPCEVKVRFARGGAGWTLTALSAPGTAPLVARWIETLGPASIRIAGGLAPKLITANFHELPTSFAPGLSLLQTRLLALTPDGSASVFLDGPPQTAERFAFKHQLVNPGVRMRDVRAGQSALILPPRQNRIIALAVALGYYEVPHRLTLRALGKKVGLSAGTVAATLRAAEATIVAAHIDAVSHERWEDGGADAAGGNAGSGPGRNN